MDEQEKYTLQEAQLKFAKSTFNRTWELLDITERTPAENEELIHAAHTSLYHWLQVGTPVNAQRGEWMLAHVYTVLEQPSLALKHAARCMDLTEKYQPIMKDFDLAFAHEGLARAYALAGEVNKAREEHELAKTAGEAISDPEDKQIFSDSLKGGNWYGIA
jgi:cytochrome c1